MMLENLCINVANAEKMRVFVKNCPPKTSTFMPHTVGGSVYLECSLFVTLLKQVEWGSVHEIKNLKRSVA